ncbi:MAG: hypothetical protein QM706_20080 [Nitrospira sp.]
MDVDSILLADPDSALLDNLSFFISSDLPGIELTVCTSAQQTVMQLSCSTYSTVIVASCLIQEEASILLHHRWKRHALVPLILTAGREDLEPAHDALLHEGAFDVIVKPIDPINASASIRVALWQAQFLRLLTQRARVLSQIQNHLSAFPHESIRGWVSKRIKDNLTLIRECKDENDLHRLNLLLNDLSESVEAWTLEQAMDRLKRMRLDHSWT